ncbi:hypothetical protein COEREDRAFT_79634 [Coemansia reversa NRRL 1564]|uniref:Swiss Army Knife RNA repair protein HAD domain-containing protein n=1 Tax=Coemansia reversa (strain ATCC 12441 / NRRL 1564) TaxID=763665 RepID=A0A2G5BHZ5_COERN|nr:hypothetical protein COEREDRAFT_79634 [Coemansia reversa NRRL 1564]|eukprot:PIA18601.1 hypothetical protein COEREDRAFT_79634 [Coemansia reversa NRRL 1564]
MASSHENSNTNTGSRNSSDGELSTVESQASNLQTVPHFKTCQQTFSQTRYQVTTDPSTLKIPIYTSTINWSHPICETDFLYRRQLSELRQHKQGVQRLSIFDFDNTLFKSPLPNPRLWDQKLIGMLRSTDLGWFQDSRTLSAPYLEYSDSHWIQPIVRLAQAEMQRKDTLVVLLTGRSHAAYRQLVLGLLEKHRGLRFDIVILKETPTRQSPLVSQFEFDAPAATLSAPLTFDYKMGVVEDSIAAFPGIRQIMMWDDRTNQCERMQHYLNALSARSNGWITNADVYHVPPQTLYMREENERSLISDMVDEYNDRVRVAAGITDKAALPVGALEMKTYPSYTAVFLSSRSRAMLRKTIRSPVSWTKAADHMTVTLGPADDDELGNKIGAVMGERVDLVVDSIGTLVNRVIAVRVSQLRTINGRYTPKTLSTPHITVAYNEPAGIRPSYSRNIQKWKPLRLGAMVLQGTVGEHKQTTASIIRPAIIKEDVSIGGLVCQRWPALKGKDIGMAVASVRQQMTAQEIQNLEANRGLITEIVDKLF